jgi:hypothetical protein
MDSQFRTISILLAVILLLGGLIFIFYDKLLGLWTATNKDYAILIGEDTAIHQDFQQTITLGRPELITPEAGYGLTFTWSMFIESVGPDRIWHTSYAQDKPIVRLGNSPQILYNPKYNVLKVQVVYKESPFYAHYPVIELRDLPLDTWSTYAVVIENNRVKIYFNGTQVVNRLLAAIPLIEENTDIILGEEHNNMVGRIKNMRLYFRPYSQIP